MANMSLPNGQLPVYGSHGNQDSVGTTPPVLTCCSPNSREEEEDNVKRPMNAFIVWSKTIQKKITDENPKMHISKISKLLGKKWKGLTNEVKWPYIDESKRLRDVHMKKYPNYRYKPKMKKHQPLNRFPMDTPYQIPFKTRPQTFPEMTSHQAAARSLWNVKQGQYSGIPATGSHYKGEQVSTGPANSYGYSPPVGAANGSYRSSAMPNYSYRPPNNWTASGVPALFSPVNGYANHNNCSLPGTAAGTANVRQDLDNTYLPQAESFNFSEEGYSSTPNVVYPINCGSSCSMQLAGIDDFASNLDNPVGTNSSVASVESYECPILGENPENGSDPESNLKRMINIYLEDPFGSIVGSVGQQNGRPAVHFHKYSAALVATSAGTCSDFDSNRSALAPASADSLLEGVSTTLPPQHLM